MGKIVVTTDKYSAYIRPYSLVTSDSNLPDILEIELWKSEELGDLRTEIKKVKTLDMKTCRARFEGAPSVQNAIDKAERGEIQPFICLGNI